jgi:ABC-type transport system involved in cytochrome bd biosynthesis fused ATPase/permease subunit
MEQCVTVTVTVTVLVDLAVDALTAPAAPCVFLLQKSKDGSVEKTILDNVWGSAMPGETTAIMGASGAGKTSLFNILAGRARSRGLRGVALMVLRNKGRDFS